MLRLCIDSEIQAAAAAVGLRQSGRNDMPNNSQSETCGEKTMKTHHKMKVFRTELWTGHAAREKPFADVSFYLNKTPIMETEHDF